MNKSLHIAVFCILATLAISSCGPAKKAVAVMPSLPTQSQADSLMLALTGHGDCLNVPLQFDERPKVYGFLPDSTDVSVFTLVPENGAWVKESDASYPCNYEDCLAFISFTDSSAVRTFDGRRVITFSMIHEKGEKACKTIAIYNPDTEEFKSLYLNGTMLADGRIEGSSNKALIDGAERPEIQWALATMASDPKLIELSDGELMTIQSLKWWEEKNPGALKNATKINFGQIPEECTLVDSFKTAGKEKSAKYIVAQFNVRGRSVIVAQRRATGEYILVWSEPVKYNGRTIENFYFDNDSVLSILYYQGRKSFKYRLNLSTTALSR